MTPDGDLYQAYSEELNGPRMAASARMGVLVVIGLNTGFIALDWWAHPAELQTLVVTRLVWDVVMLGVYWALGSDQPLRTTLAGLYLTGFGMLGVIGIAGGIGGDYWPGMMILFLGMPVLLPLSPLQSGAVVGTLLLGFAALPAFTGEEIVLTSYLVPVFFVAGAAVECVASSALLERLRFADFKQRREIEAARDHLREMDRTKSRFTANVHHELRTPLTLTLAPLESMLAGEFGAVSEQQHEYLKTMHVNALRLLKLINNLLDLAKIESHQLKVRRRPIDVNRVVADLVAGARPMAERKRIDLGVEGEDTLPNIHADPDAVEKVIVNLLGNALKFTDEGGRIRVRVGAEEKGVLILVQDSGIGLTPEQLTRIFDRFAQVDSSATRRHEGTGIGLSLVKELVDLHGGWVRAESDGLGMGATVSFWLPAGDEDPNVEEALVDGAGSSSVAQRAFEAFGAEIEVEAEDTDAFRYSDLARSAERWEAARQGDGTDASVFNAGDASTSNEADAAEILVCEDNRDMRRLLGDLLGREFRVRVAVNGREGLEAIRRRQPDLVLTDIMMPEMSGIELCAVLKKNPETASLPVVLITSKAEREMKIDGLERGADDYVTKPFHSRELLARVRSLIRVRQLRATLEIQNTALQQANADLERAMGELKAAETHLIQTERLAAVGELAAGVAHEANNPVNYSRNAMHALRACVGDLLQVAEIIGALDVSDAAGLGDHWRKLKRRLDALECESVGERLRELSKIVDDGLERTQRLVGDLRDFAAPNRQEHGPVDVRRTVESALQLMRYSLQEGRVMLERHLPDHLPLVYGDAGALGQVLLNLLKNASEALDGRGGNVCVEAREVPGGIEIAVEDDGPGVNPAVADRLFEPFFSTKKAGRGTGLGLSISRKVIAEHGGNIVVDSEPGRGARFAIYLPVVHGNE